MEHRTVMLFFITGTPRRRFLKQRFMTAREEPPILEIRQLERLCGVSSSWGLTGCITATEPA